MGTPKSTHKSDVAKYLNQFLTDPDVIPLPWILRQLLVRAVIVPRRAEASSVKYKKIWTTQGSPLLINTNRFAVSLNALLGSEVMVKVAMRYGEPTIESQIAEMVQKGIGKMIVCPMFPQYAEATTGTVIRLVNKLALPSDLQVEFLAPFFRQEDFVDVWQKMLRGRTYEHLLMSFHGLPKKQNCAEKSCLANSCKGTCYQKQCEQTASAIANKLGLQEDQWTISFQSRLGAGEWLRPYTDDVIEQLKQRGIKQLTVISPAFVADCLETLEELGMEVKAQFERDNKDSQLTLVPSLNDDPEWVRAFAKIVQPKLKSLDKSIVVN